MKIRILVVATLLLTICIANPISANKAKSALRMALPSCSVNIQADNIETSENQVTYSGNVTVLVGFASLRSEKVTIVKKSDGRCELISES